MALLLMVITEINQIICFARELGILDGDIARDGVCLQDLGRKVSSRKGGDCSQSRMRSCPRRDSFRRSHLLSDTACDGHGGLAESAREF